MHPLESLRRWARAGLLTELGGAEAERLIPQTSTRPAPSPALIRHYYDAEGDSAEAAWRRQQDRYVEVPVGACPGAVADQLENVLPAIGNVHVRITAHALIVNAGGDVARVARVVRHRRIGRCQVRRPVQGPRHVIQAINAILARRGDRHRFVELNVGPNRLAFIAVAQRQGDALLEWGATRHGDHRTLCAFAGWALPRRARVAG